MTIKTTKVFEKNLKAYVDGNRYIINQGGARSSKTYSIVQLLILIAMYQKKETYVSIVSATLPHLKRGAMRDFFSVLQSLNMYDENSYNRTDKIYRINKTQIEFFSVDTAEKVYGSSRDLLFINEANNIDEERARQLVIRTRGAVFFDFNPTCEFYVHTDYMTRKNSAYIHSTFADNPYLDENIKQELHEAGERNQKFKRVFVDGEVGKLEGVVFDNWDIGEFDTSLDFILGQDFGFASDPSTLVKIAVDEGKKIIYLDECFYKNGLTTNSLFELNRQYAGNRLIVADRSNPRLIDELKALGNNIVPAVSADGSGVISTGLLTMQDYMIIVTENSTNLMNELKTYVWLDERGKLAIDKFNHAIDAARYGFMYQRFKIKQKFFVV
jgi:phage terminase large subunit